MQAFHNKAIPRKLARTILWVIPAFTLLFLVFGIMASGYLWPLVVIVYSAFIVGLGYCDTHLSDPGTAPINTAGPGERLRFAVGFFCLQIFVAPITLILVGGLLYLGITLVSKILGSPFP